MAGRVADRMGKAFTQAEEKETCLVPKTPADARWLQRAARRGEVVRPALGIYARTSYWVDLSPTQRLLHQMRALSAIHPSWVFAGCSAAVAHGLDVGHEQARTICIATTARSHSADSQVGKRIVVSGGKTATRQGIPVTTFTRTVYDCLHLCAFPEALAIADSAMRVKGIGRERLTRNVAVECRGMPGLQRVMEIIALADGRSENGGESKVRAQIIKLGFVVPQLQQEFHDHVDGKTYYVDFAWDLPDGTLVIGELDGKDKYTNAEMTGGKGVDETLLAERRRESHITVGDRSVKVLRFSFAESQQPARFARLLELYGIPRASVVPAVALT